jgi:hypothetical protein
MKTTAKFVTEITVTDPDSGGEVELDVFKHENGGMFAIDASYLDQAFDDDKPIVIPNPFHQEGIKTSITVELTGI